MEIRVEKYNREMKAEWDAFVSSSRNGTFLFNRAFMEYHSDRFEDASLLFYLKNKLIALLPANRVGDVLYSHQGLTYGGLILSVPATAKIVLDIFDALKLHLGANGIKQLVYKAVPHIYHRQPSEEDLYALYRNDAVFIGRSVSSCIDQRAGIKYSELRRRGIKKALNKGLTIRESSDFSDFWKILETNLSERFDVQPVHTLPEIEYLKSKFPDHIHLYEVCDGSRVLGGCVIFETERVAHVQYISASKEGKEAGALDYLFDSLIQKIYINKPFFEFGISTEKNGSVLNEGLISQKEGFGGRGIVYDTYQLQIKKTS